MLNHPDKSGGNNERFSYLKSLYDKADRALSLNGNSNDDVDNTKPKSSIKEREKVELEIVETGRQGNFCRFR